MFPNINRYAHLSRLSTLSLCTVTMQAISWFIQNSEWIIQRIPFQGWKMSPNTEECSGHSRVQSEWLLEWFELSSVVSSLESPLCVSLPSELVLWQTPHQVLACLGTDCDLDANEKDSLNFISNYNSFTIKRPKLKTLAEIIKSGQYKIIKA